MDATDFPDSLGECVEKFWSDNPDLKRQVLKDWYSGGRVTHASNEAGRIAIDKWLAGVRPSEPQ